MTVLVIIGAVWAAGLLAFWVSAHCAVDDVWEEPTAPINLADHRVMVIDGPKDAA